MGFVKRILTGEVETRTPEEKVIALWEDYVECCPCPLNESLELPVNWRLAEELAAKASDESATLAPEDIEKIEQMNEEAFDSFLSDVLWEHGKYSKGD